MALREIDRETGEFGGGEICIRCSPQFDHETGEREVNLNKRSFKIPLFTEEKKPKTRHFPSRFCCGEHKYTIFLMILTLIMILPAFGVTVWILIETVLHFYIHRKPHLMARYPFHRLVFAEFCAVCQSERCMNIVGKLQDMRTNKMRQYVRNIPIGT